MSKQLTDWFAPSVKPKRRGVYEVRSAAGPENTVYAYWNGNKFGYRARDVASAFIKRDSLTFAPERIEWRGLASDPSQSKEGGK